MARWTVMALLLIFSMPVFAANYVMPEKINIARTTCNNPQSFQCEYWTETETTTVWGYKNTKTTTSYLPSVCRWSDFLLGFRKTYRLRAENPDLEFRTKEECVAYCVEKHGTSCEYSPDYKAPKVLGESPAVLLPICNQSNYGKYACFYTLPPYVIKCEFITDIRGYDWDYAEPPESRGTFDSQDACKSWCTYKYKDDCVYSVLTATPSVEQVNEPLPVEEPYVEQLPVEEQKTPEPPAKISTEMPSSCPVCVKADAVWCEDRADPTNGYCTYGTSCDDGFFERSGFVQSCDQACTTSRDGIEPSGECVNILRITTDIAGGYFVSGFCNGNRNAAYQCFIRSETVTGCQSCIESSNAGTTAIWCRTDTTGYCAHDSDCIGDAVEDATQCDDYVATGQEPSIQQNGIEVTDGSDIIAQQPDWWQGFLNWLGWR